MEKITQVVFENISSGKIDKKVAAEILKILKIEGKTKIKDDIAIIGLSAKLPSANNYEVFWENLKAGADCITDFPEDRKKDIQGFLKYTYVRDREKIEYCQGGYIKDIDKFDYKFFGLSPKEASLMDPNQRVFLETAWNAIEDAGYGGNRFVGSRTGLYIGYSGWPMYGQFVSQIEPESLSLSVAGNMSAIIASRIPYLLNLRGPSMLIDTACSSSLVALHTACQAIKNGDCEQAIVGGIRIILTPVDGLIQYGIESKDYRAKAFDDDANGTSLSEGIIAIVIKPLKKAVADRDNIYAVIKGSAINQDGASIGITAPNVLAQEDVIVKAWEDAGIDPETISYIEAHGTGTILGDPIEIDGLQKAFRRYTDKKQFCAIGSVKTNFGHLDSSAGLAGLLKATLALKHKELPASLHFNKPNKKINFEKSPVFVNDKFRKWESDTVPRRCGVSSFGFSGTNCHVVLEEAKELKNEIFENEDTLQVFSLSAKSLDALKNLLVDYNNYMKKYKNISISDICYTANTGRGHYSYRMALIIRSMEEFKNKLQEIVSKGLEETDNAYFGYFKSVPSNKERKRDGEVTEYDIRKFSQDAGSKIEEFISSNKQDENILKSICKLYSKGADVDWEEFYKNEIRRRVSLPVYPFDRIKCWLGTPVELIKRDENKIDSKYEEKFEKEVQAKEIKLMGKEGYDYNETEKNIAKAFSEVLGLKEIDVNDTFSDLGGDSMLAIQLLRNIEKIYPNTVEIADLFSYPTISKLSEYINEELGITQEVNSNEVENSDVSEEENLDKILENLEKGILSVNDAENLL